MSRSRYEVLLKIASGGMGTVHVARMHGGLGFQQLVAVKRPHPYVVEDPKIRDMLVREAHVASSIRHANVVTMRDVEVEGDAVLLVMDYVEGGALSELVIPGEGIPPPVAVRIALDALGGLHAAHEATDQAGVPLGVVHRDVSPHNILVGTDGVARVADFGIAKCMAEKGDASTTGSVKGKLAYMAPEYVQGGVADLRVDLFAIGIVLWESLTGKRLFRGANDVETLDRLLHHDAAPLAQVGPKLNAVLARALAKKPGDRFATADELVEALDRAARAEKLTATHREVGGFVRWRLREKLEERREKLKALLAGADGAERTEGVASPVNASPVNASPVNASTAPETVTEELLRKHGTARVPIVTAPLEVAPLSVTRPLASTLRLEEPWSPRSAAAQSTPSVAQEMEGDAGAARASVTPEPIDEVPAGPPLSGSRATLVAVMAAAALVIGGSGWAIRRAMSAPVAAASLPDREARDDRALVEQGAPAPVAPGATANPTASASVMASSSSPASSSSSAPSSGAAPRPRPLQSALPRPLAPPATVSAPHARPAVTELPPDPPRRRNPYE